MSKETADPKNTEQTARPKQRPSTAGKPRVSGEKRLDAVLEAMTGELLAALEQDYTTKKR